MNLSLTKRIKELERRLAQRGASRAEREVDALCRRYLERKMPDDYDPAAKTDELIHKYFKTKR